MCGGEGGAGGGGGGQVETLACVCAMVSSCLEPESSLLYHVTMDLLLLGRVKDPRAFSHNFKYSAPTMDSPYPMAIWGAICSKMHVPTGIYKINVNVRCINVNVDI